MKETTKLARNFASLWGALEIQRNAGIDGDSVLPYVDRPKDVRAAMSLWETLQTSAEGDNPGASAEKLYAVTAAAMDAALGLNAPTSH